MVSHLQCLMYEVIRPNNCIPLKFPDCPGGDDLFHCWQQLGKPLFSFLISYTVLWVSELYYLGWDVCVRKKGYCVSGGTNLSRTTWKHNRTVVYEKHLTPSTLPHKILITLYTCLLKNPPKRGWGAGTTSAEDVGRLPLSKLPQQDLLESWGSVQPDWKCYWSTIKSDISD